MKESQYELNKGLAQMLKGGVIMDVTTPEQARIAKEAGACAVMAKCRIRHFVEAQILQAIEIDYIDELEVLSPADDIYHIDKTEFNVPFVCGARDLGEALRRINEGASMIRTKGEPGTGDVVQGQLLRKLDILETLTEMIRNGLPVLATCAGLILLSDKIENDDIRHIGTLPVTIKRNAYGRQLASCRIIR